MKNTLYMMLLAFMMIPWVSQADNFINLTPKPQTMTVSEGELLLPKTFSINVQNLSEDMVVEVEKFIHDFNKASDYSATITNESKALFQVSVSTTTLGEEGYELEVTSEGVQVKANTATGLYFAFQTIKKILPPNVMAGVPDAKVTKYSLPLVKITDTPRFGYRGFMLDVSRHFFDIRQIKRVIDLMSYYKMNRFHWHLTDDHGWRIEIKKYPKLTTVGAVSDNSYLVDMEHGDYWLNQPYGPFFYTQDELREVVAYAKERHIEIIPEVDMPGHFCAALAAYPEFSCTPNGSHSVISNIGGVYADVMNVANPKAVQFAKDILQELMDIFPYEYMHIGGDECPTSAWENNAECIARKKELGLSNFRQLQSMFIKDIAEFVHDNNRKLIVWNEAITAGGADTKTIKETGATIMCWVGADGAVSQSANLQLDHIYTPQVPWYINRKQSTDPGEPAGAGSGSDNLETVYKQNIPVPTGAAKKYFKGVQATFWCEYVGFPEYLEYLMLPRLAAVAEAGWTPQAKRNFNDFRKRITADSTLYNYNNYNYGRHYMTDTPSALDKVMPNVSTSSKKHWYRLVTRATDARSNNCIELLTENSPLIDTYAGKNAKAGRLWTNAPATEGDAAYDYQFWGIEENPQQPGVYALVCKAQPEGSVNPIPTSNNTSGRWDYDPNTKHYHFLLADNGYGKDGSNYYYSISSDQVEGLWMNASLAGQGFAVNLYNNPSDGNGGLWTFIPLEAAEMTDEISNMLSQAQALLTNVNTYADEKEKAPGLFGLEETETLAQLLKDADPSVMTEEEFKIFTNQFTKAYEAFRQSFGFLEKGKTYWLGNSVETYEELGISDHNIGDALRYSRDCWADDAWEVVESTINADYTQTVTLKNTQTGRYIGNAASSSTGRIGYPVSVGKTAGKVVCSYQPSTADFILSIGGKNLFPLSEKSTTKPGTISSGSTTGKGNAHRAMGAAWWLRPVQVTTFECVDTKGNYLGTYRHSMGKYNEYPSTFIPEIKNHTFLRKEEGNRYVYERTAYSITVVCYDQYGAIISTDEHSCGAGKSYSIQWPEHPYYTFNESEHDNGTTITPDHDLVLQATYNTKAYNGVKKLSRAVKELQAGHSYVIYDTSPNATERIGYRNVNAALQIMKNNMIEDTDPMHVWTLEGSGKTFKVKNEYHGLYVPQLTTAAQPVKLTDNGAIYTFTLNSDGETWKIKGSNGVCWDGLGSGALVGWNDPGHPYQLFEYYAQPYFEVLVEAVNTEGHLLGHQKTLVKAGDSFTLSTDTYEGYIIKEVQGNEQLHSVADHVKVTVIYETDPSVGIDTIVTTEKAKGIFDLSGRRLQRIERPGLYIINGQKMLVK